MTDELLDRFDALIEKLGGPVVPFSDQLWDLSDVAKYLRRSSSYVQNTLTCLTSFPKAIRLPSQGRARPLYNAIEVVEWTKKFREKN
jgi:hypothetical protein